MKAIATIGPFDYPQRVEVQILSKSDTPGFYRCESVIGQQLVIHCDKLRIINPEKEKAGG